MAVFGIVGFAAFIAAELDPLLLVEFVLAPIVVALLAAELDREGGWLAVRIVYLATLLLPGASRQEHEDEWVDHVLASGEHGFRPLFSALGIAFLAAPHLAFAERWSVVGAGDPLGRLLDGVRRLREVKAFPPVRYLEDITEIQLLRMSDTEILEIQHAVRAARRRGQKIPRALIFAMASPKMSYRTHEMWYRRVRRRHFLIRLLARFKYYLSRLPFQAAKETAQSGSER